LRPPHLRTSTVPRLEKRLNEEAAMGEELELGIDEIPVKAGRYRVSGQGSLDLGAWSLHRGRIGQLLITTSGRLVLATRYNPRGTLWLVVALVVVAVGFRAPAVLTAPGLIVLYLGIRALRRKRVPIDLSEGRRVVLDDARSRVAVEVGAPRPGWAAFEVADAWWGDVERALRRHVPDEQFEEGPITEPQLVRIALITALAVALIGLFGVLFGS